MTPCYILKQTFTKVNLLNYPNNLGGAIPQTGLPQNSISTSPSPITVTPCYNSKTNFYKSQPPQLPQQFEGGAISQTGLPQNSISTSPSPITITPCYILKRTFTKVNLLDYPNNLRGGCYLANRITTKPHLHFPLPHYNDTVLYSKTNFYKSQPPQLPQQFEGGAISQTGLPQNSISTSPSRITMTPCYILKRTFTKVNLLNYPNNLGGVLSHKPDCHKTPSPLPPPPLQWHRAIF